MILGSLASELLRACQVPALLCYIGRWGVDPDAPSGA